MFPILRRFRHQLFTHKAVAVYEFPHWPMVCYGIGANRITNNVDSAVSVNTVLEVTWTLIALLQRRNIPHNVLIASDEAACQPLVVVFPRQHQCENGVGLFAEFEDEAASMTGGLRFAIAELSGLVIANSSVEFQQLTQEMFVQILSNEISLAQVINSTSQPELISIKRFLDGRLMCDLGHFQNEAESITADWKRML